MGGNLGLTSGNAIRSARADILRPMWLKRWWRSVTYSGYDWHGNAKYLAGRVADPAATSVAGVSPGVRDRALKMLCDSFNIPERQMHCLHRHDELMAIYQSMSGPKLCDQFEFERLCLAIDGLSSGKADKVEASKLKTVEDVIREVADRLRQ